MKKKKTVKKEKISEELQSLLDAGVIDREDVERILKKADRLRKENTEKKHNRDRKIFQSGGYWMVYYRDEEGEQHRIKRKTKEDVVVALEVVLHPPSPTVKRVFEQWNSGRLTRDHISASTRLREVKFYRQFYSGTDFEGRLVETVTPREWAHWLQDRVDSGITAKAWAGLRGITRGMIKYAERNEWIDYTIPAVFDRMEIHKNSFKRKRKNESDEIYYPEELAAVRKYCEENWDAYTSCLWLISVTGMRIGEAVALKPDDVNLREMFIRVHRTESTGQDLSGKQSIYVRDDTKTDAGTRDVSLPLSACEHLWQIRNRALEKGWPWLFCNDKGKRVEGREVRKVLVKACEEAGIPYKPPHKLRKTVASILIESDAVDSRTVIRQLGHVSLGITEEYYHRDRKSAIEKAKILEQVAEIGNGVSCDIPVPVETHV